jgi:hypothetical protein
MYPFCGRTIACTETLISSEVLAQALVFVGLNGLERCVVAVLAVASFVLQACPTEDVMGTLRWLCGLAGGSCVLTLVHCRMPPQEIRCLGTLSSWTPSW